MILVLLGTFQIEFPRPLVVIEQLMQENKLREEVIVQSGFTNFNSSFLDLRPFMSVEELDKLYHEARIIITHAGTGSVMKGVKMGKKVISIPRLKKYGEHIDDHQLELHKEFERLNYIYPWNEGDSLEKILTDVENFHPAEYISRKEDMIQYLKSYIDSL
jgi:UDP-N-acetylglucosamine transferase subunit ALG13